MKNYKNFEDFLIDEHAKDYCGLDDEMGESCCEWIDNLSGEEFIEYADKYANLKSRQDSVFALEKLSKNIQEIANSIKK